MTQIYRSLSTCIFIILYSQHQFLLIEKWPIVSPPNNFPSQPGTRPATAETIRKTQRSSLERNTRHKSGLSGQTSSSSTGEMESCMADWPGKAKERKCSGMRLSKSSLNTGRYKQQTWKYKFHDKKIHFIENLRKG